MATTAQRAPAHRQATAPAVDVPVLGPTHPAKLAWYAGVAAMAAVELIEWPVAVVVATGHLIADRTRNPALKQFAEGAEEA
jgi:hypothetical protein